MNKKEEILNASLKLFVENGEQATSMKWIATEAKCGIGTMYNYFPSKEYLINQLYLFVKDKKAEFIKYGFDSTMSIKLKFSFCWTRVMLFAFEFPVAYKFLEKYSLSPIITEETRKKGFEPFIPMIQVYESAKEQGIIKNYDTNQMILFTQGAIAGLVNNKKIDINGIQEIVELAWDAVKK